MRRFLIASVAVAVFLGAAVILNADETPSPSDSRSYTLGFTPQLGGVYRNPDAYLPTYPGYAPYWQSPPPYPYAYPAFYYPYGYYSQPGYWPGNPCYGQRSGDNRKAK